MSQFLGACGTVFVGIGFLCAPFAAGVTFVAYVFVLGGTPDPRGLSIGVGAAAGVAAAIGLTSLFHFRYRSAADVYRDQYVHLLRRLQSAEHRRAAIRIGRRSPMVDAAERDVATISKCLRELLSEVRSGTRWISAAGYLEAWADLDRLEEAMMFLLPREQVMAMARDDVSRLEGSAGGASSLQKRLDADIARLGEISALRRPESAWDDELAVRADLVLVHNCINRTREDQWGQLVGSRNNMMLAASVAGVIAYLALISVIVWRIDPKALQVAASFVITGTLISLLHQVTLVGSKDGGVADFGQSTARLLSASFVSGLIALLGVIVLEGIDLTVNGQPLLQPFDKWRQTFDWTLDKSGFFWAAAFGLTPSWLFQMLQNRTDAIKNSLNASRATGGS